DSIDRDESEQRQVEGQQNPRIAPGEQQEQEGAAGVQGWHCRQADSDVSAAICGDPTASAIHDIVPYRKHRCLGRSLKWLDAAFIDEGPYRRHHQISQRTYALEN